MCLKLSYAIGNDKQSSLWIHALDLENKRYIAEIGDEKEWWKEEKVQNYCSQLESKPDTRLDFNWSGDISIINWNRKERRREM